MLTNMENMLSKIKITPISWLIGISGILMVRFFLEALSSTTSSGIIASDASTLIHYYLFFISVALSTMIFLWYALPNWRQLLPQFITTTFPILFLAPIIDFIVSKGSGLTMTYLFDTPSQMAISFFTFFGPNLQSGATIGLRVEIALILILSAILIYKSSKKISKAIVMTVIFYMIIFSFGSLPGILSLGENSSVIQFLGNSIVTSATFTNNIHSTLSFQSTNRALEVGFNFLMSKVLFLISLVLLLSWFYLKEKTKLIYFLRNSRIERVLVYFSIIIMGLLLANKVSTSIFFSWVDFISIIILLLSFYFSMMFAVTVNDTEDTEIDAVSNTDRPLITKVLTSGDMRQIGFMSLVICLIGGYISGFYAFFCILTFTALYYIYSAPPTRFKTIPFFSTFIIALCSLSTFIAGFFLISSSKILHTLPTEAIVAIIIFFFLHPHMRDIKDIEGDSKAGVPTVATIWGARVTGVITSAAFLTVPLITHINALWYTSIPACIATYYFCTQKPYREPPIFLTYFAFILISGIILFF